MPDFNQEFGATLISKEPRQASPTTFRAHVKFDFIGPKVAPIKALAKKYDQKVPTAEMAGVDPFDSP